RLISRNCRGRNSLLNETVYGICGGWAGLCGTGGAAVGYVFVYTRLIDNGRVDIGWNSEFSKMAQNRFIFIFATAQLAQRRVL
ncbi:MAG: hypothetical protein WC551_11280, partial [Patescibacteria group bacterium]